MNDLYNKKYQYERLIRVLNTNYSKLNSCCNYLKQCRNKMNETFLIDDKYYSQKDLDELIKKIESDINTIINKLIPQARYQYNRILYQISKM